MLERPVPGFNTKIGGENLIPTLETTPVLEGLMWKIDVRSILERAHPNWANEMLRVAKAAPQKSIEGGSVGTSMAPPDFSTVYNPTNGPTIARELPWVLSLYENEFREIVVKITGDPSVHLGKDLAHSLNMNLTLRGPYELHADRNPWTALLGTTTMGEGEGGETIFWPKSIVSERPDTSLRQDLTLDTLGKIVRWENLSLIDKLSVWREFDLWNILHPKEGKSVYMPVAVIRPQEGFLYVFNGREQLHEVTAFQPKSPDRVRLTVPGDYYTDAVPEIIDPEFNRKIGVGDNALDK